MIGKEQSTSVELLRVEDHFMTAFVQRQLFFRILIQLWTWALFVQKQCPSSELNQDLKAITQSSFDNFSLNTRRFFVMSQLSCWCLCYTDETHTATKTYDMHFNVNGRVLLNNSTALSAIQWLLGYLKAFLLGLDARISRSFHKVATLRLSVRAKYVHRRQSRGNSADIKANFYMCLRVSYDCTAVCCRMTPTLKVQSDPS